MKDKLFIFIKESLNRFWTNFENINFVNCSYYCEWETRKEFYKKKKGNSPYCLLCMVINHTNKSCISIKKWPQSSIIMWVVDKNEQPILTIPWSSTKNTFIKLIRHPFDLMEENFQKFVVPQVLFCLLPYSLVT